MKTRFLHLWGGLSSSLWFVPSLMVLFTLALSWATITLDTALDEREAAGMEWLRGSDPAGAREILATIAASMITVAGVVFSITVVVLTLASSQFGPLLLRNFMRDAGNHVVLGTFISTFIYCLLVLRAIRGDEGAEFVPDISVTFSLALALASIGVLIYFIHHVSSTIQAPIVIARVAGELDRAIERTFPEELEQSGDDEGPEIGSIAPEFDRGAFPVPSAASGYVQAIDTRGLLELAETKDLVARVNYRPGQFAVKGGDLVLVRSGRPVEKGLIDEINAFFILGSQRTEEQDMEFSLSQLVEIAVRALSPGLNDPLTVIHCIDHLTVALCRLAEKKIPSPFRHGAGGKLRVILEGPTFAGVTEAAFGPIRQYGRSSVPVAVRLLDGLLEIARRARRAADRRALLMEAEMIARGSREALPEECDRREVEKGYRRVLGILEIAPCAGAAQRVSQSSP